MFPFTREYELKLDGLSEKDIPLLIERLEKDLDKKYPHSRFEIDKGYLMHRSLKKSFKLQKTKYKESVSKFRSEFAFYSEPDGIKVKMKIAVFTYFQLLAMYLPLVFFVLYISYLSFHYDLLSKHWEDHPVKSVLILGAILYGGIFPKVIWDHAAKPYEKLLEEIANEIRKDNSADVPLYPQTQCNPERLK